MRLTEKKFLEISSTPLLADGGEYGELQLLGAFRFRVGQIIILRSNTEEEIQVKVNRVTSDVSLEVGSFDTPVSDRVDVSEYLVADNAAVNLLEQSRPTIPPDDVWRAVYEEEPIIALRTTNVDIRYEKLLGLLQNANWMNLANFECINPSFSADGNTITLDYIEGDIVVGQAIFEYTTDFDWSIKLKKYINDDDGEPLLDDDGTELLLD